jgi:hypothetical protein
MHESDVDGMERLFASDAVMSIFNGTVNRGRGEIRDFYDRSGMRLGIHPHPQEPIEEGNRCLVEIVVGTKDGTYRRVVDIFTIDDDGQVTSLRIYQGLLLDGDAPASVSDR